MAIHSYACRFAPADIEAALGQRFTIEREIAAGGQGVVFRATRTSLPNGTPTNDALALKLHFDRRRNPRVQPEITATENFSHPKLAGLIEHGYCDVAGRHTRYVAWEFIEGQSLAARLKNGPLLEQEVLAIGRDISSAIAEIWTRRIVHGDIKPSNIMLRNFDGDNVTGPVDAVLIDLGAARYLGQGNILSLKPLGRTERRAPRRMGTLGYFSPEQLRGTKSLSCAADVFSLAVVMLQCLLGRHPTNYDQVALAEGIRASTVKRATNVGLLYMLDRMLAPNPALRPNPAELTHRFESLRLTIEAELAKGARSPAQAQGPEEAQE